MKVHVLAHHILETYFVLGHFVFLLKFHLNPRKLIEHCSRLFGYQRVRRSNCYVQRYFSGNLQKCLYMQVGRMKLYMYVC